MDERYQRQLAAWHKFMESGLIDHDVVRPVVAESWKKCREAGLDPRAPKVPVKLSPGELKALQDSNRNYMEVALPFMRFLETAVKDTGFILVLTEINGYVLEMFGDDEIMRLAQNKNYVPGCCRTEEEAGTNGISLTLELQRPLQITGPEHYNVRHHLWTCASAPVFSPTGQCLGAVTLSGETISAHRHTLGMVISAADAIQNGLRQRETEREKGRVEILVDSLLKSISEAIVTVDSKGVITHINAKASKMLGAGFNAFEGKAAADLFGEHSELADLSKGDRDLPAFEAAIEAGGGRSFVMVKPYMMHGERGVEGAVLLLSERKQYIRNVREISGLTARYTFDDIIGEAENFRRQIDLAAIAAEQDSRILITGETGTGKELFAQAIHNNSPRRGGPFVAINCAAIPRDLMESEIMGYKGGAFTGASKGGQVGKLELADGGTLFLDEISQMPLDLQAKLLRVLQDGLITRLGDTKPVQVDVRVIAATNEDLFDKSRRDEFRQDLYFRLSVVDITLPALRDRGADLALLAGSVLERLGRKFDGGGIRLSPGALDVLSRYDWPGNVRELENVLEMAAIICEAGVIEAANLPQRVVGGAFKGQPDQPGRPEPQASAVSGPARPVDPVSATRPMREVEEAALRSALKEFNGNISLVSRKLGLSRSTVYRRMKEHGILRSVEVV